MGESSPHGELTATDVAATQRARAGSDGEPVRIERGSLVGRYLVISQLGAGAMGVVYSAYDPELDRKVAVKLLQHRGDLAGPRRRLQREAQALAKLAHPNVVGVYDVGIYEDQLFVAMEFVEGQTLGAWLRSQEAGRPWTEVLEVFMAAGRGLAAAHEANLIHRDFKPDNVMLRADGVVRVMDFGLARLGPDADDDPDETARTFMGHPLDESSDVDRLTRTGALIGTPAYMSYEQFEGAEVDARSDQFSFCVALYEALYGERPFRSRTLGELVHALEAGDIQPAPSGSKVPAWLRAVIVRGLARDRGARFASMSVLLEALADDPAARRRRLAVRAGLGLALLGGIGAVGLLSMTLVDRNKKIRSQEDDLAERNQALQAELDNQRGLRASMMARFPGHEVEAIHLAVQAFDSVDDSAEVVPAPVFEGLTSAVMSLHRGRSLEHDAFVSGVAFSPDSTRLATTSWDHGIRLWDTNSGRSTLLLEGPERGYSVEFSPDGRSLVTANKDGSVVLWNASTGEQLRRFDHPDSVREAVFSPDGRTLASVCYDGYLRLWDVESSTTRRVLEHSGRLWSVAFAPDGRWVASAGDDGIVTLWDPTTGERMTRLKHDAAVHDLSSSPDGSRLATASTDHRARVWDIDRGDVLLTLDHTEVVESVAFSPDGRRLATGTWEDGTIRLWDAGTGTWLASFVHTDVVADLAFSRDGQQLASASWDHRATLWNTQLGPAFTPLVGHERRVDTLASSVDGRLVATASGDNTARVWQADTGETRTILVGHTLDLTGVAFSPDASRVVTSSYDRTARIWDTASGRSLGVLEHEGRVMEAMFSPDGSWVATAGEDGHVRLWDVESHTLLRSLEHPGPVLALSFSPDGTRLLTLDRNQRARAFDPRSGQPLDWTFGEGPITALAWSPDGTQVATAQRDHSVHTWSPRSGEHLQVFEGHAGPVNGLAFTADGARLATASADHRARVWDTLDGRLLAGFDHGQPVLDVAWVDGDTGLATASAHHHAWRWTLDWKPWLAWGCTLLRYRAAPGESSTSRCASMPAAQPEALQRPQVALVPTPRATDTDAIREPDTITIREIELVKIPGGSFVMGSPLEERHRFPDESPQRTIDIDTFYLARTEITRAQYERYMEATGAPTPKRWEYEQYAQPEHPVISISWQEAQAFCDWAGLVLPTEAQWEYAARAGTTTRYWAGDDESDLDRVAWVANSRSRMHPVARRDANPFGLFDIHGNVFEWVLDTEVSYTFDPRPSDGLRRRVKSKTEKGVLRGGSWNFDRRYARSAHREMRFSGNQSGDAGFRPAYIPPSKAPTE